MKLDKEITRPDGMGSFGKSDVLIIEGGNGGRLVADFIDVAIPVK